MFMFPNLYSTRFRPRNYRAGGVGNWSGHLPFAADLIVATKPSLIVELGTHYGESYFGFCQAIQDNGIHCAAYAVDTWRGDPQSGEYGPAVFDHVSSYNASNYASFSSLLRMTFDDASSHFTDGTIDLLHLDGCHTYDALKKDFETWIPKVSAGGVVLIHDIAMRQGDFGAWRLWEEIADNFPRFAFQHSCGLGVLAKCDSSQIVNPFLAELFGGACEPRSIQDYYNLCAAGLHDADRSQEKGSTVCQVYWPHKNGYSQERSVAVEVPRGGWTSVKVEVPGLPGRLRLDLADCVSLIEISEIVVECSSTGRLLYRLDVGIDDIACAGTATRIPDQGNLLVLSYGEDPQIYLPTLALAEPGSLLRFQCRLQVFSDFHIIEQFLERYVRTLSDLDTVRNSLSGVRAELAQVSAQRTAILESWSWRITAPLRRFGQRPDNRNSATIPPD